jgi:E3 ubiquitin-protein ligase RNF14
MDLFAQNKFDCQICLSTVRGAKCLRLNCNHIFCRPCLTEFWSLCITEGDVDRVTCADPECVKENRSITEDEVLRVVTAAEAQRWKTLKRKRALERDPGLVYCPMAFCQAPCPSPVEQQKMERDTSALDDVTMRREYISLRTCDSCEFSFCILCKRAWHSIAPCSSDITSLFLEQYMTLEEGDPERLALERRFGKAQLVKLVAKLQEDEENRKWLARSTTKCPNCSCFVEKSYGCSHMTCSRCSTHFCYLCGRRLPGDRPYDHFSERGPCKGQLFQLTEWEPNEAELLAFAAD